MVQTKTGQWAEKHGVGATELHGPLENPDNLTWTNGFSDEPRYTSKIIYFALSR